MHRISDKIVRPIVVFLRQQGLRMAPFVDDFLFLLKQFSATDNIDFAIDTFTDCGWKLNWEKCQLKPEAERVFVGFVISTKGSQPWIRVLTSKIKKLRRTIARTVNAETVTARQLARIIGQCVAMTKAVIPGKLLLWNCYRALANKKGWDSAITMSTEVVKDLMWWHNALKAWNGAPLRQKSVDVQIETDAAKNGWGAVLRNRQNLESYGLWQKSVAYSHSNYRELLAVLKAIQTFRHHIRGQHVQILSDNVTTVAYINRLGGSSGKMMKLMTTIWAWTNELNVTISGKFLAGKINVDADRLSRRDSPYDWMLNRQTFRMLDKVLGPHTIDRFAAAHNTQTTRYNSLFLDPWTEAVDAMAQKNWNVEMNFCNPPFWMLNKILTKIEKEEAEATVIAPMWTGQRWYQKLWKMSVKLPILLENSRKNFIKAGSTPEPCKNKRWTIAAWKVSGKRS